MTVEDVTKLIEEHNGDEYAYDERDYLDDNCVKQFPMYYSGWECDSTAWVMKDGTIFGTNHGQLCVTSPEEFERYRQKMSKVSEDLDYLADEIAELKGK